MGVVMDGPSQRQVLPLSLIEREVATLMGREFNVRFPVSKIRDGGWTIEGIEAAVREQLTDGEVDIVIANGLLAAHEIMRIEHLPKPVIATIVADPVLQNLPNVDGRSARKNLVYLSDDHTVGSDLDLFHSMVKFKHLAILIDRLFIETLPQLAQTTAAAQKRLNIEISLVPIETSPTDALEALPSAADAVYVPPLPRFDESSMRELASGLIERRLPSFSLLGLDTLELGLLMTGVGRNVELTRAARRVALNLQSILLGTNASQLKVGLLQPQKLAINMRTARAIGYSPRWKELDAAILLNEKPDHDTTQYTFVEAVARSVESNLSLQIDSIDRAIADDQVRAARSALLPQLSANMGATTIDSDRANPAFAAERESEFGIEASQVIYSERFHSGLDIAKLLRDAEDHAFQTRVLDIIEATATAYLTVLQANAQESVRESNVSVTEQNLELATTRRQIGQAGRSDVLRWESQLASDRQSLYAARADADQAMTELKRILNLELSDRLGVSDAGISTLIAMLDSERFQRFFDNPQKFSIFRRYQVERALKNSPELKEIESQIAGGERNLLAAKRAYYVPDVSLVGQANTNLHRGGSGSSLRGTGLDDEQWSIGVQATLPLFEGGARRADTDVARHQLSQLTLSRADIQLAIEARAIAALQKTGGTYPAMRLSRKASASARANLTLVTEAYSVGTMSVTDLIDAQNAALSAELSAAQARYAFMRDFVAVLRAVADFDLLLEVDAADAWYTEVDQYFLQHDG